MPFLLPFLVLLPACSSLPQASDEPLENVFENVRSSVVTLRTISRTGPIGSDGQVATEAGVGSGVLIDETGRILTASHVVNLADKVLVEFADGARREARVLGSHTQADVGLVQIEESLPKSARPAALGDSDVTRVGESVFVVGAPLGVTHTLTKGIVSARRRSPLPFGSLHKIQHFQTDAPINPGNSGGPMFNMRGEVIGIVSHIISRTGGSQGLGFAVTSNDCRALMLDRAPIWSGIDGLLLLGDAARLFQIPGGASGLLVEHVAAGSLGEEIGLVGGSVPATILEQELLLGGDIVLEVGGVRVDDPDRENKIRAAMNAGAQLNVLALRGGERLFLKIPPRR